MLLIDAHLDLAYNALGLQRDLTQTVTEGRLQDIKLRTDWKRDNGTLTTTLPEIRAHMPALVCGTIFILPESGANAFDGLCYRTPQEAAAQAWQQWDWYQAMEAAGHLRMVTTLDALNAVCTEEEPYGPPGLMLLMEGADGLQTPTDLERWSQAGLAWLGPAWGPTRYCGGTGKPGPLTALGRDLMQVMNEQKVALDASHLAEHSFWQALDLIHTPVAASHSNCRVLLDQAKADRFLSDDMIKAILERDGIIGLAIYNRMLVNHWNEQKSSVGLEAVVRHIEHICNLAGDTLHIGIGSDFDGGFGAEHLPRQLDRWGDLLKLEDYLLDRGWYPNEVANILGGNWRRWFTWVFKNRSLA